VEQKKITTNSEEILDFSNKFKSAWEIAISAGNCSILGGKCPRELPSWRKGMFHVEHNDACRPREIKASIQVCVSRGQVANEAITRILFHVEQFCAMAS
jgi:hypothetical protein